MDFVCNFFVPVLCVGLELLLFCTAGDWRRGYRRISPSGLNFWEPEYAEFKFFVSPLCFIRLEIWSPFLVQRAVFLGVGTMTVDSVLHMNSVHRSYAFIKGFHRYPLH
jgi:hypothetical protein